MNLWYILVIGFLLSKIDCASFTWRPVRSGTKNLTRTIKAYDISSDGTIHIVWASDEKKFRGFQYQTLSADGTLVNKGLIDISTACDHIFYATLKVSDNGQHLLIVFDGALISTTRDGYKKILFMETTNGGKTWMGPMLVRGTVDDKVGCIHPSVILEKKTGRVYIAYAKGDWRPRYSIDVYKRDPGEKSFTCLFEFPYRSLAYYPHIALTENGRQKHFTLIARNKTGELFYSRSLDAKKWTDFVFLKKARPDLHHHTVVTDNKVSKGGLYIRYEDNYAREQFLWSPDHGNTFDGPIFVGNSYGDVEGQGTVAALCGNGDQILLFTAHRGSSMLESYIKFTTMYYNPFIEIPYPIRGLSTTRVDHDALSCRYEGQGRYSVNFLVSDAYSNAFWYVYGTLNGIE